MHDTRCIISNIKQKLKWQWIRYPLLGRPVLQEDLESIKVPLESHFFENFLLFQQPSATAITQPTEDFSSKDNASGNTTPAPGDSFPMCPGPGGQVPFLNVWQCQSHSPWRSNDRAGLTAHPRPHSLPQWLSHCRLHFNFLSHSINLSREPASSLKLDISYALSPYLQILQISKSLSSYISVL